MNKVKQLFGAMHFTIGDLVDIGRRLSKEKLEEMKLISAVENSEKDNVWRLKAAIELLNPLTHISPEIQTLLVELKKAESQLINPIRGQGNEEGGIPQPENRTFPKPGTILVRPHNSHSNRLERVRSTNCSEAYRDSNIFRFLVVEQPCKLLRLGDPNGPIYTSPSYAAHAATGKVHNGWDYFEIK